MNSEQLIFQAGNAIEKYSQSHNTTCVLSIRDGSVVCIPLQDYGGKPSAALKITPFEQRVGLFNSQWAAVGESLLNLYNKEIKCQTHPKP